MKTDSQSVAANDVVQHLRDIENRLAVAWVDGDRAFIGLILADDWSVIDLTGRRLTRAEVLEEAFATKDRKIVSMHIDDLSVRSFGEWAIVTGRTHATGQYQGAAAEVTLRFTDVFANRSGNWQVVASQATLIGP
jgi:ketosteroid isomerase-like protein